MTTPLVFKAWDRFESVFGNRFVRYPVRWDTRARMLVWSPKKRVHYVWVLFAFISVVVIGLGSTVPLILWIILVKKTESDVLEITTSQILLVTLAMVGYLVCAIAGCGCFCGQVEDAIECFNAQLSLEQRFKKQFPKTYWKERNPSIWQLLDIQGIFLNYMVYFYMCVPISGTIAMVGVQSDPLYFTFRLLIPDNLWIISKVQWILLLARCILCYFSWFEICRCILFCLLTAVPQLSGLEWLIRLVRNCQAGLKDPFREQHYIRMYQCVTLVFKKSRRTQSTAVFLLLVASFAYEVGSLYRTITLFRVIPFLAYIPWPLLAIGVLLILQVVLPRLGNAHGNTCDLLVEWKVLILEVPVVNSSSGVVENSKSLPKPPQTFSDRFVRKLAILKIKSLRPIYFEAGVFQTAFFTVTKDSNVSYYKAIVGYTIDALMAFRGRI